MTGIKLALGALLLIGGFSLAGAASADTAVLTAQNGMTLYTYDNDTGGKPTCNAICAIAWPPYLANGEKMGKGWTTVTRANGSAQWAYDGKPLYFYSADSKKGDVKGNGLEGIWHDVNE